MFDIFIDDTLEATLADTRPRKERITELRLTQGGDMRRDQPGTKLTFLSYKLTFLSTKVTFLR